MNRKSLVSAVLAGTVTLSAGFYAIKSNKVSFPVPYYTIARVVDGDTFVTTENQHIVWVRSPKKNLKDSSQEKKFI